MQRDLMHTVVYHLYDDWQPTLGKHQVSERTAKQIRSAVTALTVLSCDVADPSLHSLQRFACYIREIGWEELVARMKLLKAKFQTLEVPCRDFIGLHQPYAELIRPIRASLISAIRGDARSFINVNTWLAFVVKVHVPNPLLGDESLTKWLDAEASLRGAPEWHVEELHRLFMALPPFDSDGFFPHHGSGQVAERATGATRDPKDLILARSAPDSRLHWSGLPSYCVGGAPVSRTNVLTFVPKSATALRSISMEPTLLQFLQQGIREQLYRHFDREPLFRDSIHLRDAGFNQRLAMEGSRNGNWATIDLSSASDTVSLDLVSRASLGSSWFKPLMGSRSTTTLLPDGREVTLKKFAPMGSAVAFPVECLAFLSVAKVAALQDTSTQWERQHILVYGDDIIVHSAIAPRVLDLLEEAGFTVNREKSFITGPFRESCGVEAYRGVDITPMYHRVSYLDGMRRLYPGLVAHANEAYNNGFWRLREYYISQVQSVLGRRYEYVPFILKGDDTSRLWSRTGESSPDGYDDDLQSPTRRELQVVERHKSVASAEADSVRLQLQLHELTKAKAPWPRGPLLREPHEHVVSTTSAVAVRRVLTEH